MTEFVRVIPLLVYRDIQAAHDFLVEVFGFEPGGVDRAPDGTEVHGEVGAGETVFWLHRVVDDHELDSPARLGRTSSGIVVRVDDVDAHYRQARDAGAAVTEPTDQPYGQREYEARDCEGHRWWFATPLAADG